MSFWDEEASYAGCTATLAACRTSYPASGAVRKLRPMCTWGGTAGVAGRWGTGVASPGFLRSQQVSGPGASNSFQYEGCSESWRHGGPGRGPHLRQGPRAASGHAVRRGDEHAGSHQRRTTEVGAGRVTERRKVGVPVGGGGGPTHDAHFRVV